MASARGRPARRRRFRSALRVHLAQLDGAVARVDSQVPVYERAVRQPGVGAQPAECGDVVRIGIYCPPDPPPRVDAHGTVTSDGHARVASAPPWPVCAQGNEHRQRIRAGRVQPTADQRASGGRHGSPRRPQCRQGSGRVGTLARAHLHLARIQLDIDGPTRASVRSRMSAAYCRSAPVTGSTSSNSSPIPIEKALSNVVASLAQGSTVAPAGGNSSAAMTYQPAAVAVSGWAHFSSRA